MAVTFTNFGKKIVFYVLMFACICNFQLYGQKKLSGKINLPRSHVVSIGIDRVTVDDPSFFSGDTLFMPGDTILLIQMQGIEIRTPADDSYGDLQDKLGEPGMHEFMIIQSINTVAKEIVFTNNIITPFDPAGNVQIIKVVYASSAEITGKLYCDPWDPVKKSGGVLPIIAGRELILSADIDVSGRGFTGAPACIGDGINVNSDPAVYGLPFYDNSFMNAGLKGEGLGTFDESAILLSSFATKGYGANYNGGGGGNGKYSGGGGGAHRGKGGKGGRENFFPPQLGGNGGYKTEHIWLPGTRIYFGGGGGGAAGTAGNLTGKGGNGGGIIIVIADIITGKGGRILVNGAVGGSSTGQSGSGGGGAGGSIVLFVNSYSPDNFTLSAAGGKGGENAGDFGDGGGGSGGLIYVSADTPGNVTNILNGGSGGGSLSPSAGAGESGEKKTGFIPLLNGFLFNSVHSSITTNQIDSICTGTIPPKIIGTNPVGGALPYTYKWLKTYDPALSDGSWITLASDATSIDYVPTAPETSTVFFRRIVIDNSAIPLEDKSKPVKIIVNPAISNNTIVIPHDTICFGGNPDQLISNDILAGGSGKYMFKWQVSTDNISFANPLNTFNTKDYTPPAELKVTTYYKRIVTSGRCTDVSAHVKLIVLDTIKNNLILSLPQDICYGKGFKKLVGTFPDTLPALSGGNSKYRYKWESSTNNGSWSNALGINNTYGYQPQETGDPSNPNIYSFRRIVYTGPSYNCKGTSKNVTLHSYPEISNNIISANQIICPETSPAIFKGSLPAGGNGVYSYVWQDSSAVHTWAAITNAVNPDYQSQALNAPVKFRRKILSGPADCCESYSNVVQVNLYSLPTGNIINETDSICNGSGSHLDIELTGPGPWSVNFKDELTGNESSVVNMSSSGMTIIHPKSFAEVTNYEYELSRVIDKNGCIANSLTGRKKVVVYKVPEANAGPDQVVCGPRVKLAAVPGVGSGRWIFPTGGSLTDPASVITIDSSFPGARVIRKFYWEETNWKCSSRDSVMITFDKRVSNINAGSDTSLFSFDYIFHLANSPIKQWETGRWSNISGSGYFEDNNGDENFDVITGLSPGTNIFKWEVENGTCSLSDELTVDVYSLEIPEGFSPNEDPQGYNNTFVIKGLDLDNYIGEIHYVNSKGIEVFSTTNADGQTWTDWDGKNAKGIDVPDGTYYYLLTIVSKGNGSTFRKSGFVILKRYW